MAIRTNTNELENNISKAFDSSILKKNETSGKRGRPLKKERFVQKTIKINQSDWDELSEWAERKGLSTSDALRMAVSEKLEAIRKE